MNKNKTQSGIIRKHKNDKNKKKIISIIFLG